MEKYRLFQRRDPTETETKEYPWQSWLEVVVGIISYDLGSDFFSPLPTKKETEHDGFDVRVGRSSSWSNSYFLWDTNFDETMIQKDERYKDLVDNRPMLSCVEKASYVWLKRLSKNEVLQHSGKHRAEMVLQHCRSSAWLEKPVKVLLARPRSSLKVLLQLGTTSFLLTFGYFPKHSCFGMSWVFKS